MIWEWPQITLAVLMVLELGISMGKHGQPRDPYSFWTSLFGAAIVATLLYFGGFWG